MRILVLGASGLLGNALFRVLSESKNHKVFGTIRHQSYKDFFIHELAENLLLVDNLESVNELMGLFDKVCPDVVINCVSLSKDQFSNVERVISIFSLFPQRLNYLCAQRNTRLIHISSDCVFSGKRGQYTEEDFPDAMDNYGQAKILGEVNLFGAMTIRISIIGNSIGSMNGLLDWFLSQSVQCSGYEKCIFSGFPTVVLSKIIHDYILPNTNLSGIYHLSSPSISKYNLLKMLGEKYQHNIKIISDSSVSLDRSLLSNKFTKDTGYTSPDWDALIDVMYGYNFGIRESNV